MPPEERREALFEPKTRSQDILGFYEPTARDAEIQLLTLGCLQRIADSLESMSESLVEHWDIEDRYRKAHLAFQKETQRTHYGNTVGEVLGKWVVTVRGASYERMCKALARHLEVDGPYSSELADLKTFPWQAYSLIGKMTYRNIVEGLTRK